MEEIILLGESLTIATVAARRNEWRTVLRGPSSAIQLSADNLKSIDTAGLQLILALQRDAARRGKCVSISGDSEVLRRQSGILGLNGLLLDQN